MYGLLYAYQSLIFPVAFSKNLVKICLLKRTRLRDRALTITPTSGETTIMRTQASDLLSARQVSQLLNISEKELEKWRSSGDGPEYIRTAPHHRSVKYSLEAVMCYLKEKKNEEKLF